MAYFGQVNIVSGLKEKFFVTVIPSILGNPIDAKRLKQVVSDCLAKDDVFRIEFLEAIIFYGHTSNDDELSPDVYELLTSWGTKRIEHLTGDYTVLPGPYVGLRAISGRC
jgi:hypothetical protein